MSKSNNIDYTTYFSVKVLPKIQDEPTYAQLKNIKDTLKANASRVTSELGGGAHGHQLIMLSSLRYHMSAPFTQDHS